MIANWNFLPHLLCTHCFPSQCFCLLSTCLRLNLTVAAIGLKVSLANTLFFFLRGVAILYSIGEWNQSFQTLLFQLFKQVVVALRSCLATFKFKPFAFLDFCSSGPSMKEDQAIIMSVLHGKSDIWWWACMPRYTNYTTLYSIHIQHSE